MNLTTHISLTSQSYFICDPIELKIRGEVWNSSSYNLNGGIRFWARELMLLPTNRNSVFGILSPIFFVFTKRDCIIQAYMCVLMYLATFRDYSRKDKCNSLLLIVEDWTELGLVVFPFALGVFHVKILVSDLFLCCMSLFIYCY